MAPRGLARVQERRVRERDIVAATRRLFDERGLQDAPMDEIARACGLQRALLYRYFASKDELFVLTVTHYLDELTARAHERLDPHASAVAQLRASWENFTSYCLEYPAFLDCALSLMRQPAQDLRGRVTEATWFALGRSMAACLEVTIDIVRRGRDAGVFDVPDPAFTTNCLYAQTLGMMHLARSQIGVAMAPGGLPDSFPVSHEAVQAACVEAALLAVGVRERTEA